MAEAKNLGDENCKIVYIVRGDGVSPRETPVGLPWEIDSIYTNDRGRVSCLKFLITLYLMVHIIFIFADGDSKREFQSTFDAFEEIVNAYNMCEDYFIGALRATTKKPINILDAESYLAEVGPVKDYLERAVAEGIDDIEICEFISQTFFMNVPYLLASWKKHMREYSKSVL